MHPAAYQAEAMTTASTEIVADEPDPGGSSWRWSSRRLGPVGPGRMWRRRTGIEPAWELVAPTSVLKTAGPTRNPDASDVQATRTRSRCWLPRPLGTRLRR